MSDDDLKLETTFSSARSLFPYGALALALAGIAVIVLSVTTGISAWLLPMDDRFLAVLIPAAPDGSEALSLKTLEHATVGKTLVISGTVFNRTGYTITSLQAVVDVRDRYTLPVMTAGVPVEPMDLKADVTGMFQASIVMEKELGGFSVRFRLPDEGPFVPHKDERPDQIPVIPEPK